MNDPYEPQPTMQDIERAFYNENPQAAYDLILAFELKRMDDWLSDLLYAKDTQTANDMIYAKADELRSRVKDLMRDSHQETKEPRCPCYIHGCRG